MHVRLKADISGTRNGQPWPSRGTLIEVPDEEGTQLCRAGLAIVAVAADEDVETTTPDENPPEADAQPVETATAADEDVETRPALTTGNTPSRSRRR